MTVVILLWFMIAVKAQVVPQCPAQEVILPCRCLERINEYQIWCSHSDLTSVLSAFPSISRSIDQPIDEVILENNNLPSLPGKTFSNLKVVRLMLRYNGLQRTSSNWLIGLEDSLMELYLVEPELKSFPADSLTRLVALEAVTIQSNMLKRLPSFSSLPKLNYLQVESSSLMELSPRNFKHVPSLEKIHIIGSPFLLKLEEDLFHDMPSLKLLNISYSGLSWLHPRAISRLPSLIELSFVGNKLGDAPMIGRGIRDLPNLQIVHLDFNVIERLPEASFVDLVSVKIISLSNNRIVELQRRAFHRVPMLKTVNLNQNFVRHVDPESFLEYSSGGIEELWMADNDVGDALEIRSILMALPRLNFLDLSYNNLEMIPFGALRGHLSLERLNLNFNRISYIDREALIDLPVLRELSLRNNSLSDDLDDFIWDLPNLKGLDLSGNYFRRIKIRLLENLPSLRRIDLSSNGIDYIDPYTFLNNPILEYINISHNYLSDFHNIYPFRTLIGLYELDASFNQLSHFIYGLPKGLEYLHLKNNKISSLPLQGSEDLDLPALKMLDLSANNLKVIQKGSLRTMPALRKLYLGRNSLRSLDNAGFSGLGNLEVLDLQSNLLTQIPPHLLHEMIQLKTLNLNNNKLTTIRHNLFQNNAYLKSINLSRNQIKEIPQTIFDSTKEIEFINASYNNLGFLPLSLNKLYQLKILDLTKNKLTEIYPDNFSNLKSLSELHLSQNKLKSLKSATFDNLDNMKMLYLNKNEINNVETNTFRSLPIMKHIKLNSNKIRFLNDFTFNNLPNLQVLELQDNLIEKISKESFHVIPQLLLLNLSSNLIADMNQAGLQTLKSLEMLDMSYNRMIEVESSYLDKMEWLVELKMDNNAICGVRGVSFNKMPRLRVLSLRNNKMMSFPERAVHKLRENIAILDIDGNPLACTCSLLWLRAWLKESSTRGPRCLDGSLLVESRLSREDCVQESRLLDPVSEGCEAELLSLPHPYDSTNIYTPWMRLKGNSTNKGVSKVPMQTPEDSDYFYDEYVDYHLNETIIEPSNDVKELPLEHKSSTEKMLFGNTPTIYAATKNKTNNIPKEVSGSPSSSGFTFFGLPLPTINLSNLWNSNGRKSDKNLGDVTSKPIIINENQGKIQQAERKTAIVNKPSRGDGSRTMFPLFKPEIESGGFVPLLPGSGGFKPIPNPNIKLPITEVQIEKADVKVINVTRDTNHKLSAEMQTESYVSTKRINSGHPIPSPTVLQVSSTTEISNKIKTKIIVEPNNTTTTTTTTSTTKKPKTKLKPAEVEQIKNISEFLSTTTPTSLKMENTTSYPDLEISNDDESFKDIFKEVVENVTMSHIQNATKKSIEMETNSTSSTLIESKIPNPKPSVIKPALLAPGGYQPPFRSPGISKITKITSPFSTSSPIFHKEQTGNIITALPHNIGDDVITTEAQNDKSWYFANYNEQKQASNYNYYGKSNSGKIYANVFIFVISLYNIANILNNG